MRNRGNEIKTSRWNKFFKYRNGYLVYNTMSSALIWVDDELGKALKEEHIHHIPYDQIEELKRQGLLIDDKVDELRVLKAHYWRTKFRKEGIGITIVPTYRCNMMCAYCYEGSEKPALDMDKEVSEEVCKWLIDLLAATQSKYIFLIFYGGEPLLKLDSVCQISERLKDYCSGHSLEFKMGLVTNGTLLSSAVARKLIERGLCWLQVTIDGPPQIHDERRHFKSGKGTFSIIYDNLKSFVRAMPDNVEVVVRINTDKGNYIYIPILFEMLKEDRLSDSVTVSIGQVIATSQNLHYLDNLLSDAEASQLYNNLLRNRCLTDPFKRSFLRYEATPTFCGAQVANSFVIDPLGKIYKCWELLNRDEFCIGDIKQGISTQKHLQWLSFDPFQNKKCLKCIYLPRCGGGCRARALFRFGSLYECVCPWPVKSWETMLKRRARLLHENKLRNL